MIWPFRKKKTFADLAEQYATSRQSRHEREYEERRKRLDDWTKQNQIADVDATTRAITYRPAVQLLIGGYQDFLEITPDAGPVLQVPVALIANVVMQRPYSGRYNGWEGPSSLDSIIIEMHSGTKHQIRAQRAVSEMLLDGIKKAWLAERKEPTQ